MSRTLAITVTVEPDSGKNGLLANPPSFEGVKNGMHVLYNCIGNEKVTFFVSRYCYDYVKEIERIFEKAEFGALFYPGDFQPEMEMPFGSFYKQSVPMVSREILTKKLTACREFFKKEKAIRFGSAWIDVMSLAWFGDNPFGFTHSSSTCPSLLSADEKFDHRCIKWTPFSTGKIIEVPLSIFGGDRNAWVSPTRGFGLTDNVFEIMRKADHITLDLSMRDLVPACSPFTQTADDSKEMQDRFDAWMYFSRRVGMTPVRITEVAALTVGI